MKNKALIIILGVISILGLTFAYAAFNTNLNIMGTSTITSNWNVEITGVTSNAIFGSASNESAPVFSESAVTFKTLLVQPGDKMEYNVTVTNNGTLPAKLESIDKTDSLNPAIVYKVSGINQDDVLEAKNSVVVKVTVEYLESVTNQPENLLASLTVKLNFVQA